MEVIIVAIIIVAVVKWAVETGHLDWQASKGANRKASAGKPVSKRAAAAVQHDVGYWLHQALNGFPETRGAVAEGWHASRTAQTAGLARRQRARAEHLALRARVLPEIRDYRRAQQEALDQLRAARQQPGEPEPSPDPAPATPADLQTAPAPAAPAPAATTPAPAPAPVTPPTEGSTMPASGDTTYTEQLSELQAMQRDAEAELASVTRKRMTSRLDILQGMGLDSATLADAAAIDDALQAAEKAAQQVLDMTTTAITNLKRRHGAIQEAVDSSPVDKPADPEFYQS